MYSGRLKQSRATSAAGFFAGLLFIGLGCFVVIPLFGTFGIIWTLLCTCIAAFHGYGFFSKRGVALYEAEIDNPTSSKSMSEKLKEVEEAKRRGQISETEYTAIRMRILSE